MTRFDGGDLFRPQIDPDSAKAGFCECERNRQTDISDTDHPDERVAAFEALDQRLQGRVTKVSGHGSTVTTSAPADHTDFLPRRYP